MEDTVGAFAKIHEFAYAGAQAASVPFVTIKI
jgi:hypothetical protein